jgi:hypothetical protein
LIVKPPPPAFVMPHKKPLLKTRLGSREETESLRSDFHSCFFCGDSLVDCTSSETAFVRSESLISKKIDR